MFRRFFAVQDNRKTTPPRSSKPNHKIDPFLDWINEVSMRAWHLAKNVSVDEQTQGMKTYKKEGDGFQCDALCNDRYTFVFFFRHKPPPKNMLIKASAHYTHM